MVAQVVILIANKDIEDHAFIEFVEIAVYVFDEFPHLGGDVHIGALFKLFQVEVEIAPTEAEVKAYLTKQVGTLNELSGQRWSEALDALGAKDIVLVVTPEEP